MRLFPLKNRPYKNTLAAIKAVEKYNENSETPLKLIMTGDSSIDTRGEPIGDYIRERGLYFDVISIPRVPDDVHAALYHCADCAIAASYFEGGTGSFVFDEAVSVGTPTFLSHNLSHDEGFRYFENYQFFNFNPNKPSDLAALIEKHAVDNFAALYDMQWRIAQFRATQRPWSIVQAEYAETLDSVVRKSLSKPEDK